MLLKYASYLRYLPLLAGIIEFVRTAENEFRAQGSGAEKAEWAEQKFVALIALIERAGLIKPRFAEFLRDSAATLVKTIVEWYKDAQGDVPARPTIDN
jgi:hypothetical protein